MAFSSTKLLAFSFCVCCKIAYRSNAALSIIAAVNPVSSSVVETVFSSAVATVSGSSVTGGLTSWLAGPIISSVGMLSVVSSSNSSSVSSNSRGSGGVDGL